MKHGQRKVMVNEIYKMNGNTVIGWTTVNAEMTIDTINQLFKAGEILTVNIRMEGTYFGRDYNYKTFRINFPTLETYFERLIEEAMDIIKLNNGLNISKEDLNFRISDLSVFRAWGIFCGKNGISLDRKYLEDGMAGIHTDERIIQTIIHEVGHYVHQEFFNDEQFRFPTAKKSRYAYTNYLENFAEAFMDLMTGANKPERNERMTRILWTM